MKTVGDLKRELDGYPDDAEVIVSAPDGTVFPVESSESEPSGDDVGLTVIING